MAFTGTPVVTQVSDGLFRITGVSLAASASGTIGLIDKTVPAEISLVSKVWGPYRDVDLSESVSAIINAVTPTLVAVPITVNKTGTKPADFEMTLENVGAAGGACVNLTFNLVFVDDGATDPPNYSVVEGECSVTLQITWDAGSGLTQPTLAAAEAALEGLGYTVTFAGTGGGTDFSAANFAVAPGNTWTVDVACTDPATWDMDNLVAPPPFVSPPLVEPQPPESPPNVLTGEVTTPEGQFACADGDSPELEIYVRFH